MPKSNLLKRQQRIAMRKKLIEKNYCPNCNIKLRENWHGGMHCPKCNWE